MAERPANPDQAWLGDSYASDDPRMATPASIGGGPKGQPRDDSAFSAAKLIGGSWAPEKDPRLSGALERLVDSRRGRVVKLQGTVTAVAGAVAVIELGGPPPGFVWSLRRLNVGPSDYIAGNWPTSAITVMAATGQAAPGTAYPTNSALQVLSVTTSFPAEATWSEAEATLLAGEKLFILTSGLAAGYLLTAGGQAVEVAAAMGEQYGPIR